MVKNDAYPFGTFANNDSRAVLAVPWDQRAGTQAVPIKEDVIVGGALPGLEQSLSPAGAKENG